MDGDRSKATSLEKAGHAHLGHTMASDGEVGLGEGLPLSNMEMSENSSGTSGGGSNGGVVPMLDGNSLSTDDTGSLIVSGK